MRLHPFAALRPKPEYAARVASVPYDVVDRAESAHLAEGNPLSFLRVVRAELELPPDVDPYDPRVYERAKHNLQKLIADGVFVRESAPCLYVYRLVMDGRAQTGIAGCVHIEDYERDLIKKHEKTRPDKEDDRTRHILALDADAEPVLLAYAGVPAVQELVDAEAKGAPLFDFTAPDGVRHTVWRCANSAAIAKAFGAVPCAYVADGHHRCASAWRAGAQRRAANRAHRGDEEYSWFPATLFPTDQLRILPYHRVLKTPPGFDLAQALRDIAAAGSLQDTDNPAPPRPGTFGVYTQKRWRLLALDPKTIDENDPVRSLDVDLLQTRVLEPIFGIRDPRTDKRIEFVGGIRGTKELEKRVDSGEMTIAFSMFPTGIAQLLAVADAGLVMPPKSTWFEPKLRSGLFVHELGG